MSNMPTLWVCSLSVGGGLGRALRSLDLVDGRSALRAEPLPGPPRKRRGCPGVAHEDVGASRGGRCGVWISSTDVRRPSPQAERVPGRRPRGRRGASRRAVRRLDRSTPQPLGHEAPRRSFWQRAGPSPRRGGREGFGPSGRTSVDEIQTPQRSRQPAYLPKVIRHCCSRVRTLPGRQDRWSPVPPTDGDQTSPTESPMPMSPP
jgi:hypothetical protein